MDREVFDRHVRDALGSLYDLTHLQRHPLTEVLALCRQSGESSGECLRRVLWETVESLRPDDSVPRDRAEWINYRLLWLHYLQAMEPAETYEELGLSRRSYYRRHGEALAALSGVLWELYRADGEDADRANGVDAGTSEAVRLAMASARRPVDLRALIEDTVATAAVFALDRGVTLTIDCPPTLPQAHGDRAMFHQILLNILTQGISLCGGPRLSLTVRACRGRTNWLVAPLDAEATPEDVTSVPELALSQALLQVYGGELALARAPECALSFHVPTREPRRLIVVDDDPEAIAFYRRCLTDSAWAITPASSGRELQALLNERVPDAILLDVLMPQEDGWELLQRLKSLPETRDIPVVISSVLSQPGLALSLGAASVLLKPVTPSTLLDTLQLAVSDI